MWSRESDGPTTTESKASAVEQNIQQCPQPMKLIRAVVNEFELKNRHRRQQSLVHAHLSARALVGEHSCGSTKYQQ